MSVRGRVVACMRAKELHEEKGLRQIIVRTALQAPDNLAPRHRMPSASECMAAAAEVGMVAAQRGRNAVAIHLRQ